MARRRRARHLRTKFLLLAVPVVLGFAMIFLAGFAWLKRAEDARNAQSLMVQQALRDAALISRAVWTLDDQAMRTQLRSMIDGVEVRCVRLLEAVPSDDRYNTGRCDPLQFEGVRLRTPVSFRTDTGANRVGVLEHWVWLEVPLEQQLRELVPVTLYLLMLVLVLSASAHWAFRIVVNRPLAEVAASIHAYRDRGERRYVSWSTQDELGEFIREYNEMLLRQEMTERNIHEQTSFQQALRETLPTPFAFLDRSLCVFEANTAFVQQLGAEGPAALRPAPEHLVGPDWEALQELQPGQQHRQELLDVNTRLGTRSFEFAVSALAAEHGEVRGYVGVWTDISDSVNTHRQLTQARNAAEDTLVRLRATQQNLVQSEKFASLGGLVAGIAHEINTPLGISVTAASHLESRVQRMHLALAAGTLRRSDLQDFVADAEEACAIMVRALDAAVVQIRRFKQVSSDHASSLRRGFELASTLGDVLLTLRPGLKRSRHQLRVEIPSGIELDSYPGPLGQVVTNCFNNALLHGFDGIDEGEIAVTARTLAGGRVQIIVADNGRGIPPEHLNRVFDPFFTTRLGRGGSGLGMHLVYTLVTDVLGGQVQLDSTPGKGTQVLLDLPCVAPMRGMACE